MGAEGVEVSATQTVDENGDVVVFIDTPSDFTGTLRVRLNDNVIYSGNPEK